MSEFNLLIVEDSETQLDIYNDVITQFNKKSDVKILPNIAKTFKEGKALLKTNYFDGAIIDLRLTSNTLEYEGVALVKEINGKLRIPFFIVSASLNEILDIPENVLLQKRNRTDSFKTILEDLVSIYNSGITTLLKPNSYVDSILTDIFWNHLPIVLNEFIKEKQNKADWDIQKVLFRYIASHVNEYLELNNENNFEPYHSVEFYIKPSVKPNNITGHVLKNKENGSHWIILTPVCDLVLRKDNKNPTATAKPKANFITIASIDSYEIIVKDRNSGEISKLKSNNYDFKYHYLPKTILFEGGFIDFQNIQSIPVNIIDNDFSKELIISYPFKKDIISRFANYFARQGQPSFE